MFEPKPVIPRLDARRQLGLQGRVVEVDVQVGQDRPARLQALDPLERPRQMRMRRMRPITQGVHDPDVEPRERRERGFIQVNDVAGVGDPAETIAHRAHAPVVLVEIHHRDRTRRPVHLPADPMRRDRPPLADRRIAAFALEDVAEPAHHRGVGRHIHVAGDLRPLADEEGPHVVDAMHLVGVVVGQEDAVQPPGARLRRLQPQVRRGVDDRRRLPLGPLPLFPDEEGTARAQVLWVRRIAGAPVAVRARHPARRTAAQQGHLQGSGHGRGIRSNRAKNASSVRVSASGSVQPRISASLARMCGRKAGSLRRPR